MKVMAEIAHVRSWIFFIFSDFYCFRLLATRCVRTHFLQKYATFPEVQIYFQSHRFFHRSQLSSGGLVSRLRPVTKSPQNVTGRNRIPSTCHEIPPKRDRSQRRRKADKRSSCEAGNILTTQLQPPLRGYFGQTDLESGCALFRQTANLSEQI